MSLQASSSFRGMLDRSTTNGSTCRHPISYTACQIDADWPPAALAAAGSQSGFSLLWTGQSTQAVIAPG